MSTLEYEVKANLISSCLAYEGPHQQEYFWKSFLNIHLLTYNKKYIFKIRNAYPRALKLLRVLRMLHIYKYWLIFLVAILETAS